MLDAVQQDDRDSLAVPNGRTEPARGRSVPGDPELVPTRAADDRFEPIPAAQSEATPILVAQTPWLLLALGSGSRAWKDAEEVATDSEPEGDLAASPAVLVIDPLVDAAATVADSQAIGAGAPNVTSLPANAGLAVPATGEARTTETGLAPSFEAVAADADPTVQPEKSSAAELNRPAVRVATPNPDAAELAVSERVAPTGTAAGESGPVSRPETSRADRIPVVSGVASPDATGDRPPEVGAPAKVGDATVPSTTLGAAGRAHLRAVQTAASGGVVAPPAGEAAQVGTGDRAASITTVLPERAAEVVARLVQAGDGATTHPGTHPGFLHPQVANAPATTSPLPEVTSTPTAAALPPAVGEQVLNQVVSSLRMQWKDGIGEAKVQLRPDAYGQVSVVLKVEAGAVTAVVRADSADVQEWVVKNQETLRQQLEAAGLRLNQLVVSPDDQRQRDQQAPHEQRRRRQPATTADAGSTFEKLL